MFVVRYFILPSKCNVFISVLFLNLLGRVPQPYVTAYSATKFALDGFFAGLRQELLIRNSAISVTTCIIGLTGS